MFKRASENSQSRTDRAAVHNRTNESGVDPAAFAAAHADPEVDRAKLIRDKTDAEAKLALINAQLRRAKGAFTGNTRNQSGHEIVAKWESQRATLVGRLNRMNALLSQMNFDRKTKHADDEAQHDNLPKVFMAMAREMLADEIYNRVFVAAVHRMRDAADDRRRKHTE
jgi:hypothetical protein